MKYYVRLGIKKIRYRIDGHFTHSIEGYILITLIAMMCMQVMSRRKFFCIYRRKTFKIISLLSLSGALVYLLYISEYYGPYSAKPVSATFGGSSSINTNNNFLKYKDDTIEIDYPAGWIHELHARGLITFLASSEGNSNTYPAGLGIVVQQLKSKNMPLNEITKIQIKNLTQSHPDFRLIESSELRLSNNIAKKIVFTATDDMNHERKAMQIWTLNGDKAYLITYKAEPGQYSKYLPTIQKMIDSFQFIR